MSLRTTITLLLSALVCASPLHAEPTKLDHIVDLLHEAKKSAQPLPILEKAKGELKDVKAKSGTGANHGKGGRGLKAEANDRKGESMESLDEAIALAKAGKNATPKIDAAISEVRNLEALKH